MIKYIRFYYLMECAVGRKRRRSGFRLTPQTNYLFCFQKPPKNRDLIFGEVLNNNISWYADTYHYQRNDSVVTSGNA